MRTPLPADSVAPSPLAGPALGECAGATDVPDGRRGMTTVAPPERRILAVVGETRRTGRWAVPRLLRVRAMLGEVRIDLRETPIPHGFTLDVRAIGSRVTLVVPPGIAVVFDVFAALGNAISQAHEPATGESDIPVIRVAGSAVLGEVRVLVRERGG